MIINGVPVFIEFSSDRRVFELVTEVQIQSTQRYRLQEQADTTLESYEVDWCDSHDHYHVHKSGGPFLPQMLSNCMRENGELVPFYYWAAAHLEVGFYEGTDPTYCVRIGTRQLPELILPNPEHLRNFLFVSEIPSLAEMDDGQVGALLDYWERRTGSVEEGEVIWCSLCKMHHDFEDGAPCEHVRWCDACGFHSVPPDRPDEKSECSHRSEDGACYKEPAEEELHA